jgi:hypothetical protein
MAVPSGTTFHDLKPRLAESFVEAGKDVAVVTFGVDFISAPDHQHVALQGIVDAADDHGDTPRRSISASLASNTISTGVKVSVTRQMIPTRAAIRCGVMALQLCCLDIA